VEGVFFIGVSDYTPASKIDDIYEKVTTL